MSALIDHYPSRVTEEPRIVERIDPVVYADPGRASDGPLSAEQLARYERDGYLFFERFFPEEETAGMRRELERIWAESAGSDAPEVIREPGGEEVRSVFAVHRSDPFFSRLARDPRLLDMVEQILGSRVYIHQSRINFKPGFHGKEFPWHSDFETWHVEDGMPRMRALSCSIALTANTPHNGPLLVVPGSHRHYVACVGRTPKDHYKASLRRQEYGVPDPGSLTWLVDRGGIVGPTGPAGSLILFDCNLMHGSNGNITPWPRSNVFLVYNSVENALVEPFSGMPPRPGFVAGRDFTPLR